MKNWKKAIAICASAAAMASMAACGGGSSDGDSSSSKSDKKTIGFVAVGPEGGFRTANENDLKKAFEDAGFDLVYSPTQNNDQQKQIQAFNKFVNDEVDAIVLSATNDSGWDDCLENAAEAEIPVFTVDRNIDIKSDAAKKAVVSHIGPSNVWAGEQAAEFVNKSFPDGANGFILEGPAGLSVVTDRGTGWDNKAASNIKVLESQSANWSTDEAKTVTAGLLDKYKSDNPQFIFAQNDEMGLGAAQAVDAAGLKGKSRSSPSMAPRPLCSLWSTAIFPTSSSTTRSSVRKPPTPSRIIWMASLLNPISRSNPRPSMQIAPRKPWMPVPVRTDPIR